MLKKVEKRHLKHTREVNKPLFEKNWKAYADQVWDKRKGETLHYIYYKYFFDYLRFVKYVQVSLLKIKIFMKSMLAE